MKVRRIAILFGLLACSPIGAQPPGGSDVHAGSPSACTGAPLPGVAGLDHGRVLSDGGIAGFARMNINIDGYGRAYHPGNAGAGALIHLCNAGEVILPDGGRYHGSIDNATCTGRFMNDVARIGTAGWTDPSVGAVRWYGILGTGQARIGGRLVEGVVPVHQADGSGFFVSPTSLFDARLADPADQRRYVNPLRIPAAVIPGSAALRERGVVMGSFGVAIDRDKRIPVPFVVGDGGPRVGEGTPALARAVAGLPITDQVTRQNRFTGQVDGPRVMWIFFGAAAPPARYDHTDEQALLRGAAAAFAAWGGPARALACLAN